MKERITITPGHLLFLILLTGVVSFGLGVAFHWHVGSISISEHHSAQTAQPPVHFRPYANTLVPEISPRPIFTRFPRFMVPIKGGPRYKSAPLVQDKYATLKVDSWRYSYNARGIIEVPNYLNGRVTAVIIVHPWGIDDGQGWDTPQPAGASFFCTPGKNQLYLEHTRVVLAPFIERMRGHVALILYTLPGEKDDIRSLLYSSMDGYVSQKDRNKGRQLLREKLRGFTYRGGSIPHVLKILQQHEVSSYFEQFPGLDASQFYNSRGYWALPVPLVNTLDYKQEDIVFYDKEGYPALGKFLTKKGIRHILLAGYTTDMCVKSTAGGYENLKQDFNVFLVGDASLATFPAQDEPNIATTAELSKASLKVLVTETSWISFLRP
jgi:hypothetical protein